MLVCGIIAYSPQAYGYIFIFSYAHLNLALLLHKIVLVTFLLASTVVTDKKQTQCVAVRVSAGLGVSFLFLLMERHSTIWLQSLKCYDTTWQMYNTYKRLVAPTFTLFVQKEGGEKGRNKNALCVPWKKNSSFLLFLCDCNPIWQSYIQ